MQIYNALPELSGEQDSIETLQLCTDAIKYCPSHGLLVPVHHLCTLSTVRTYRKRHVDSELFLLNINSNTNEINEDLFIDFAH